MRVYDIVHILRIILGSFSLFISTLIFVDCLKCCFEIYNNYK